MSIERIVFNVGGVKPRIEQLHGEDHWVVPTVAMVAGVLNGSEGAILYETPDMEASKPLWNNKPLVIYHPRTTAADPVVLNTRGVGIVLNTRVDGERLKMDSWFNRRLLKKVDKRVDDLIANSKMIEVSTGLGIDFEAKEGEFKGRKYKGIARNYRPDHLAILPDQIGASSIADGAGLLRNNADPSTKPLLEETDRGIAMAMGGLSKVLNFSTVTNEKSFQEVTADLYSLLQARYGYNVCICAVYDDYLVFEYTGKLYQLPYKATDAETSIGLDPVEVYRSVSYVTVKNSEPNETPTVTNLHLEEGTMTKKEMASLLITNGFYTEADRATIEGWEESRLTKLVANVKQPEAPQTPPVTAPKQAVHNTDGTVTLTKDQFNAMNRVIQNAAAAETREREELVPMIMNAEGNIFNEEFLKKADIEFVRGVGSIVKAASVNNEEHDLTPYDGPILNNTGAAVPTLGQTVLNGQAQGVPVLATPGPKPAKK